MYLNQDGQRIKITFVNGKTHDFAIQRLSAPAKDKMEEAIKQETDNNNKQYQKTLFKKYMPVMVKSEMKSDEIIKSILFDKEAIEKMDDELKDVLKSIFSGRAIATEFEQEN